MTTASVSADASSIRRALTFFKVMAFVVGVGLLLLVLGVVLRYGFDEPRLSEVWSPIHGFLYMVYMVATANLGFKLRWSLGRIIVVMLAGTIPFLSFVAEWKVSREVEGRLSPPSPAGGIGT